MGKKFSSEDERVSVLFVQTLQVIIINVNQMLDLLTLGTCHVIQYLKRAKDGTQCAALGLKYFSQKANCYQLW